MYARVVVRVWPILKHHPPPLHRQLCVLGPRTAEEGPQAHARGTRRSRRGTMDRITVIQHPYIILRLLISINSSTDDDRSPVSLDWWYVPTYAGGDHASLRRVTDLQQYRGDPLDAWRPPVRTNLPTYLMR